MARISRTTKSLLPFDMSVVDEAVQFGTKPDAFNPVFTAGSPENMAARAQALADQLDEMHANAKARTLADHDAQAKRHSRLSVLGKVAGGDFGGLGANFG